MRKSLLTPLSGITVAIACGAASLTSVSPALGQSSTNGVYGGYVGSSAWFASMRATASNQAMLRSLSERGERGVLPADYVEVAGRILCPGGNPFPKGRFPDLRIRCRNTQLDSVERAPFVDDDGSFYTVFKRGATYDLYWMGYFGGLEKFASVTVASEGPRQRTYVFEYRVDAVPSDDSPPSTHSREPDPGRTTVDRYIPPKSDGRSPLTGEIDGRQPGRPSSDFEEQRLLDAIRYATTIAEKLSLLERLGRYFRELDGKPNTPPVEPVRYRVPVTDETRRPTPPPAPTPAPTPAPVDVNSFDLAEFPATPTTFEEQQVLEAIRSATTAQFKAEAHEKLARYYDRKGAIARAQAERSKAQYWSAAAR